MNNLGVELPRYQNGIYFHSMQSIGELNPALIKGDYALLMVSIKLGQFISNKKAILLLQNGSFKISAKIK